MTMLSAGERAPEFDLPDLAGQQHRLEAALQLGPALAVFWKSGCNTCDLTFSYLQRLAQAYPEGRWQLLAISQEGAQASEEFARQHGLTFPILIEGEGWPVSQQYDPDATPTLYLIEPDGVISMTSVGFHKQELNEISRRIAERLGERPQVIAEDDDGNPPFRPG